MNKKNKLIEIKSKFDKLFEQKIESINSKETIKSIDSMPFYMLKNIFEGISDKLYDNECNRHLLGDYMKEIRHSNGLTTLYRINETVNKNGITELIDGSLYLNESIKLFRKDGESYTNSISGLRKIVKECVEKVGLNADTIMELANGKNKELNESLEYVLLKEKNTHNLPKYLLNFTKVSNYLNENKKKENKRSISESEVKLDSLLNGDMESWEKEAVERITLNGLSGGLKSDLFEEYKNECLNLIKENDENGDTEMKARMGNMKLQLEAKNYNEESYIDDILIMAELKETLE